MVKTDYKVGVQREIVNALRPIFGPDFPYEELRNKVKIGLEYPLTRAEFPAIYVTFTQNSLRNAGVGHIEYVTNNLGEIVPIKRWVFDGSINFHIITLNPVDRDKLVSTLVNIIAFGKEIPEFKIFHDEISDADYVGLILQTETITPGGETTNATPWQSEDERTFEAVYSLTAYGEFVSDPRTGEWIEIGSVIVYPHIEGTEPPTDW